MGRIPSVLVGIPRGIAIKIFVLSSFYYTCAPLADSIYWVMHLLTENNPKTNKSMAYGFKTYIMHLAPAWRSGYNVCQKASVGCAAACLNTSGHGCYQRTQKARIRRTKLFFESRAEFFALLVADIYTAIRRSKKHGLVPCFRLNGTSDLPWESITIPGTTQTIFDMFPTVQFYDYTAIPGRNVPVNCHLTFSRKESNPEDVQSEMSAGRNVAVVFKVLPNVWNGVKVIDGTKTDMRFCDPVGVIVGLLAKGRAKKDTSGFVV